jgi:hypothetical protein
MDFYKTIIQRIRNLNRCSPRIWGKEQYEAKGFTVTEEMLKEIYESEECLIIQHTIKKRAWEDLEVEFKR